MHKYAIVRLTPNGLCCCHFKKKAKWMSDMPVIQIVLNFFPLFATKTDIFKGEFIHL